MSHLFLCDACHNISKRYVCVSINRKKWKHRGNAIRVSKQTRKQKADLPGTKKALKLNEIMGIKNNMFFGAFLYFFLI